MNQIQPTEDGSKEYSVQRMVRVQAEKDKKAHFIQPIISYVSRSYDIRVENESEFSSGQIITYVIHAKIYEFHPESY